MHWKPPTLAPGSLRTANPARSRHLQSVPSPAVDAPPSPSGSIPSIGFFFMLAFIFVFFARVPEFLITKFGIDLPLAKVLSVLVILAAFTVANPARLVRMPAILGLLGFTVWILLATPFSSWRGGTVTVLKDYWAKSIVICLAIAIVVVSMDQMRKIMYTIASATLLIVVLGFAFGETVVGRLTILEGSLSNPNEVAGRLLTGLPFCLYVLWREPRFSLWRFLILPAIPALLFLVLRTGSRSGLVVMITLFLILVMQRSIIQKIMWLAASAVLFFFLLILLPRDAIDRYLVFFAPQESLVQDDVSDEQKMAIGSRLARTALLREGISLTLRHPIFGVGPGVYPSAAAKFAEDEGRRAIWHETHNTYLQVSSEAGIPALLIYFVTLGFCLSRSISLYRATRRYPGLKPISDAANCLLLALVSWSIGAFFDSQAYRMEFPMLAALLSSFFLAAEPKVRQHIAEMASSRNLSPLYPPSRFPFPQPPLPTRSS